MAVVDNASNTKKAWREGHFESLGCLAHTLQLVVNDGVSYCLPLLTPLQCVIALLGISNILL